MTAEQRYGQCHAESVVRSEHWRTVENSAAYLAPHLRAGLDALDVGCGPRDDYRRPRPARRPRQGRRD